MLQPIIPPIIRRLSKVRSTSATRYLPAYPYAFDIAVLAAIANSLWLWRNGYGNLYYAAAVKSMLMSWHNFFFVSFDPSGFISVDKPPLGLWVQAMSAKVFGFNGLSLLLPQALAGVLSVVVLYHLVCRIWGSAAAALAALLFALTPIVVATNRNNTMDSLLVLTVLFATWAASRAAETGHLRPLLLCAALVGLGFNTKGLQAYLVLPSFVLPYALSAAARPRVRIAHLALASLVLLGISSSWATIVDLTPPAQRPFVGSSNHNSELDLLLGYDGLDRLLPNSLPNIIGTGQVGFSAGAPGPLRLLNDQIGWLLPLAFLGLLVATRQLPVRPLLDQRWQSLTLWGTWLFTQGVFFSIARFIHPYYLVMLAPAIAALGGIGLVALWWDYRSPGRRGWVLPVGLIVTVAVQVHILSDFAPWSRWLAPLIVVLCVAAAGVLTVARLATRWRVHRYAYGATAVGAFALLISPTVWASVPVWHYGNVVLPIAGPELMYSPDALLSTYTDSSAISGLAHYLQAYRGKAQFLVATRYAGVAMPLILATGQPVMTYGGYLGRDRILTRRRFAQMTASGVVRFIMVVPNFLPEEAGGQDEIEHWVRERCALVPADIWQTTHMVDEGGPLLYDCIRSRTYHATGRDS